VTWLLVIAGCNRIYGLDDTQRLDAQDEGPPPSCPEVGAPRYSRVLKQPITQNCREYTTNEDMTASLATCTSIMVIGSAMSRADAVDAPLAPFAIEPTAAQRTFTYPRLSPEGDRLVVEQLYNGDGFDQPPLFSVYALENGTWQHDHELVDPMLVAGTEAFGTPSRRPARIIRVELGTTSFTELVEDPPGTWRTNGRNYPPNHFGITDFSSPVNLSPDGLRIVFAARINNVAGTFYASRRTLDEMFGPATQLEGVPPVVDPFMTANCGRVYFSGLGTSIFYAEWIPSGS
jgi:hypothetical protein